MRLFNIRVNIILIVLLILICIPSRSQVTAQSSNPALQRCTPSSSATAEATATEADTMQSTETAMEPVLYVVTTVAPITNIAYNIGGSRIKVYGLIPEGADSHTFEPKPSAAEALSEADVIFMNGLHLEEPTRKLAEANLKQGAEIVALGEQTIDEKDWVYDFSFPKDNGSPNPHLWVNPLLALKYAEIIRDTLAKRDPDSKGYYEANYNSYATLIGAVDQALCDAVDSIPEKNRKLLTYHDSFAYFAPRYGVSVIGAIQPADFSEPSAQDVAKLIDQIKSEGVPAIFGSEVFPSKIIDQIGKESGVQFVETLSDDDLPNKDSDRLHHSYLQMMVNNGITIAGALGGNPAIFEDVQTANLHGPDNAVENAAQ